MTPEHGHVRFGPGYVELKDLYLVDLYQYGSTLQPTFFVLNDTGRWV